MEDELTLLQRAQKLREEYETSVAEEEHVAASMQQAKEQAAQEVAEAMQALEEMSNSMHETRTAEMDDPMDPADASASDGAQHYEDEYEDKDRRKSEGERHGGASRGQPSYLLPGAQPGSFGSVPALAAPSTVLRGVSRLFPRRALGDTTQHGQCAGAPARASSTPPNQPKASSLIRFQDLMPLLTDCSESGVVTQQI
mmetsp:Transcript_4129/g.10280  ORF Transcript_4129/g.10280 Transcript_4129/m.10280 type:complete len:198 (-) Transcript_4129:144-737(-)